MSERDFRPSDEEIMEGFDGLLAENAKLRNEVVRLVEEVTRLAEVRDAVLKVSAQASYDAEVEQFQRALRLARASKVGGK